MRANGHARVSARNPSAFGICDRDGQRWNLRDLRWQNEWSGIKLQNLRILVCPRCLDRPNEQLRAYAVPPDPLPVRNPRPDSSYMGDMPTIVTTIAGTPAVYELDGFGNRILDGYGNPFVLSGTFTPVLPFNVRRYSIEFDLPVTVPLWVNLVYANIPSSGAPYPDYPGTVGYVDGGAFILTGVAAQAGVNVWTPNAGMMLVVQTLSGPPNGNPYQQFETDQYGNLVLDENGNPIPID